MGFFGGAVIGGLILFSGCQLQQNNAVQVVGAVLPHHLLVTNFIDDFYALLAQQIKPQRVILLSPNHFDYGTHFIQTATETPKNVYDAMLDLDAIRFLSSQADAVIENKDYFKEHGIYVHYPFIKKYFPDAKIIPIIFKIGTPQEKMDKLIGDLSLLDAKNTLVLASVDFTHYVSDEIALENDNRTIAYFKSWSDNAVLRKNATQIFTDLKRIAKSKKQKSSHAVAIDSPESIYTLLNYLHANRVSGFQLWRRTSSQSFAGVTDSSQNTSHIFGYFKNG